MSRILLNTTTATVVALLLVASTTGADAARSSSLYLNTNTNQKRFGRSGDHMNSPQKSLSTDEQAGPSPFANYSPAWYGDRKSLWLSADAGNNAFFEYTYDNQLNAYDAKSGRKFAHHSFGSYPVDDSAMWSDAGPNLLVVNLPDQGITNPHHPNDYAAFHKSNLTQKWRMNFTDNGGNACAQFQRKNFVVVNEKFFAIAREYATDGRGTCDALNLTLSGYDMNAPSGNNTPAWFWPGLPSLVGQFTVFGMDYAALDHPSLPQGTAAKKNTTAATTTTDSTASDVPPTAAMKKTSLGAIAFMFKTSQGFSSNHNIHRIILISGVTGELLSDCTAFYDQWPILNESPPSFRTSPDGKMGILGGGGTIVTVDLVTCSCHGHYNWTVPQEQGDVQEVMTHDEGYISVISYSGGAHAYNAQLWYYVLHAATGEAVITWTSGVNDNTWQDNNLFGAVAISGGWIFAAVNNVLQARKLDGYGNVRWSMNMTYTPDGYSPTTPDVYVLNKNSSSAEDMIIVVGGGPNFNTILNQHHKTATIAYRHCAHCPTAAPTPRPTSPPNTCHHHTSCYGCTGGETTCGWCDGKCLYGKKSGPIGGTCHGHHWNWFNTNCEEEKKN